jgi:fatty acid desaturase
VLVVNSVTRSDDILAMPACQHGPTTRVEWPTLGLIAAFDVAMVAVVVWHAAVPVPLLLVAFALLGGFHMSLLHEVLHGHPTPTQWLNEALVWAPSIAWLPYPTYRDSHRLHHRVALTVPGADPESFYVDAPTWGRTGRVGRAVLWVNRTILGRVLVWPAIAIVRSLRDAGRKVGSDAAERRTWVVHLMSVALTLYLVCVVGGVSWWVFLLGFNYGGLGVTYVRSFAEHLAVDSGSPCAVVRANPVWALLFLNNNLHHTHHARPGAPWYRLPELRRQLGSDDAARAGAGWYRGYGEIARRYLVRPFDTPIHPQDVTAPT